MLTVTDLELVLRWGTANFSKGCLILYVEVAECPVALSPPSMLHMHYIFGYNCSFFRLLRLWVIWMLHFVLLMPWRNGNCEAGIRNKKMGSLRRLPQHLQKVTLKIRRKCEGVVNSNLDRKPSATGQAKCHWKFPFQSKIQQADSDWERPLRRKLQISIRIYHGLFLCRPKVFTPVA